MKDLCQVFKQAEERICGVNRYSTGVRPDDFERLSDRTPIGYEYTAKVKCPECGARDRTNAINWCKCFACGAKIIINDCLC
jgi:hypothetical protein